MTSWRKGIDFKRILMKDREVKQLLTSKDINSIFDTGYYLKHIDYIFKRVFSSAT